jgi:FAD/FMN-containing dehydrogenase
MAAERVAETQAPRETTAATGLAVWNWAHEQVSYPRVVTQVGTVEDIRAVLRDPATFPSPVRAQGSAHSTSRCGEADGGTIVDMRRMNRIVRLDNETVTAEAGALYIDVANELERHDLQLYVNIELGNATMGSVACCATKDASFPGEFGQVNSYATELKMVTPSGELLEVTENDPELLAAARSSYGLFGIVYEVTFRVRPLQAMAVSHRVYAPDEFVEALPKLVASDRSLMLYIFPYLDRIAVEARRYTGDESIARAAGAPKRFLWRLRNFTWKTFAPSFGYAVERYVPARGPRYFLVDRFNRSLHFLMDRIMASGHTVPTDQMIRYPPVSGRSKYTFSIWAFPEDDYPRVVREYFAWAKRYFRDTGFRPNLLHVGYRIAEDKSSLLSYSYDGTVITIDPVATGAPGWLEFLDAYNEFCSEHGGYPLINQTPRVTREQARKAFGERLARLEEYRRRYDPEDRLLSGFYRELLR